MTLSAVLTTYLFGLVYFAVTGTYFFYDSFVPIAVFLGMHLLFTDPSTSPRTRARTRDLWRALRAERVALYQLLGAAGVPTFYDKLLQVPILNLSVKLLDRAGALEMARTVRPGAARSIARCRASVTWRTCRSGQSFSRC